MFKTMINLSVYLREKQTITTKHTQNGDMRTVVRLCIGVGKKNNTLPLLTSELGFGNLFHPAVALRREDPIKYNVVVGQTRQQKQK